VTSQLRVYIKSTGQVVMTKTLTGYMSRCHKDIINNVIFAFKMSLLSERHLMTVVINPTSYSRHMSCLWRCHVSRMHTPSSKMLPGYHHKPHVFYIIILLQ